jgi:hypothetical protein
MTDTLTRERLTEGAAAREVNALGTRKLPSPKRLARMAEARDLYDRACSGNLRALADLQEAMSTSDFSYIFGDVLDRELMQSYQSIQPVWQEFARRSTVNDFRPKHYVDLLGGQGLLERVGQLAPYPQRKASDNQYILQAQKYGGRFSLSWEDIVNDDLGALRELPARLAQGARDTEDFVASSILSAGSGPNPAMFGSTALSVVSPGTAGGNLLAGNPALSVQALSDAITAVQSRRDVDNRPVVIRGFLLVVPPSLEVTARNILGATEIRIGNTAVSNGQQIIVGNWLSGKIRLVVDPWLPVVDLGANAATTWYLLPDPASARPAAVLAFLRGHETPDLRYADAGGMAVGGGAVPAQEGSFENDDISYRVRHILGATSLDPIATAVSNGSGS